VNETISAVMTAATLLVKKDLAESMKSGALELARMYGGNVQVQIDVKRDSDIALMRITEYNV